MVVQVKRFHRCATASLHVPFLLQPSQTYSDIYSGCAWYTRISRPFTAFVTSPILTTHDARCDPTREATASRVHQEKSNLGFLAWTARQTLPVLLYRISKILSTFEKCLHQRVHVCETTLLNVRYSSLRAVSVLVSDSFRDKVVTARFSDDSIGHEHEQLDGVIQNSRITTSRYHSNETW